MRLGALEAGGTKMVCAVCDETGRVETVNTFPTTSPEETMPKLLSFFQEVKIEALGIGCFGPVDLDINSDTYGYILNTPKQLWRYYPIVAAFQKELGPDVAIGFDTDVNAAMLGEAVFGAAKDISNAIYITIGTGVGVGVMLQRKLHHGMRHPEAGHILLSPHPSDSFHGTCPFHQNCFEGLAAGPAVEKRWGRKGVELQDEKQVWELEAYYIAQALVDYTYVLSPQRIILGGGIMHQAQLLPLIRAQFQEQLGNYMLPWGEGDTDAVLQKYIVTPQLKDQQGIIGAALLGWEAGKLG